jgi:cytochrome c oxidase cbb3-type subunit III
VTRVVVLLLCLALTAACEREQRRFSEVAPASGSPTSVPDVPGRSGTDAFSQTSPYAGNAWAVSEGKRLYQSMNCSGCHFQGGGGMGPALMDDRWAYGGDPRSIYTTIVDGRPNGMPAFGGKLADQQIWQLVAYVQALSGHVRVDVRPSRDDHMQARESEQARRHDRR